MSHSSVAEKLARLGYVARGAVYLIIGGLAFLAAIGSGGRATDSKGALQALLEAPFGGVAPLLTMLNSCSANVVVVNIDSGFKGGYVAALIARRMAQAER